MSLWRGGRNGSGGPSTQKHQNHNFDFDHGMEDSIGSSFCPRTLKASVSNSPNSADQSSHHHVGRWRDLLPLPQVGVRLPRNSDKPSVGAKRRAVRRVDNAKRVNDIIHTLNEMAGFDGTVDQKCSKAHKAAHQQLFSSVSHAPRSATPVQVREAVDELLHHGLLSYESGEEARSTVRSFHKGSVSLPESGAQVFQAHELLDEAGRDILEDPFTHLFAPEVVPNKKFKPYMDVILKHDKDMYEDFVYDLWSRGMLTFGKDHRSTITPFFVIKKNGRLRLVLDCRRSNEFFAKPPDIAMAAGYSFSQLHMDEPQEVFTAQSDIKDYFYSIGLPAFLHKFFCLPPVRPAKLADRIPELGKWVGTPEIYPQMQVVPMGWSWAMFFAQRIHQHQVMIGANIPHEQVLVDGRPAPNLSSGKVVIVPYADNLNVIGTKQEEVQKVKDLAAARLRQVGFRVHEEEDAQLKVKALGFVIDGANARVHPVPEKRDKLIAVLRWMAGRPKVSGRSVERILGHCVHFFMLRRELLSIFRSMYDFKTANYNKRTKLWKTAAQECRWASDLLFICYNDLAKPWSGHLTVSDACLTGTACCAMEVQPQVARDVGSTRELWRYKCNIRSVKARDLVAQLDPFKDTGTVLSPQSVSDPFQLNEAFENVPYELATSNDRQLQFAAQMHMKERITLLEGRATVQSIRHKARSAQHFGKRHVHFGDNLGMVLAFDRGRAKSVPLLICCRRAAAYSIAIGCQFFHRWVPSEWNQADGASRQWEDPGNHKRISQAETKMAADEIIYPCGRKRGVNAIKRLAAQENHPCAEGSSGLGTSRSQSSDQHGPDEKVSQGKGSRRANGSQEEPSTDCSSNDPIPRADNLRGIRCLPKDRHRLPEESGNIQKLLQFTAPADHHSLSGRCCIDHVPQPSFRRGSGHLRSSALLCSCHGGLSNGRKTGPEQNKTRHEGLVQSGLRTGKNPLSVAVGKPDCSQHDGNEGAQMCPLHTPDVQHIHEDWGSFETSKPGPSQLLRLGPELGCEPESFRGGTVIQGGCNRREHSPRQSPHGLPGPSAAEVRHRTSSVPNVPNGLLPPDENVEASLRENWVGERLRSAAPTPSLRSLLGQTQEDANGVGGETPRKMGLRQQSPSLRQSCKDCPALRAPSSKDSPDGRGIAHVIKGDGVRIFLPMNPNGKKPTLEIFAGCASLSKALCRQGFAAYAIDSCWGPGGNLLNSSVLARLQSCLTEDSFSFVHFGMPCESWSRARKFDGGPPPLRDDDKFLYGYPNRTNADKLKIERGNSLLIDSPLSWLVYAFTEQYHGWLRTRLLAELG